MNGKMKKILAGIGLLGAFGLGGAALAGAQGGSSTPTPAASPPAADQADAGQADEKQQNVTGPDADRAGQAALASVGGGKVLSVEKETPEAADPNEKPDANEKPDPNEPDAAKEQAIDQSKAYSVSVQKTDGTKVDVTLDSAFKVLQSEQDNESSSDQGGENAG
jgi:hypothetical protein